MRKALAGLTALAILAILAVTLAAAPAKSDPGTLDRNHLGKWVCVDESGWEHYNWTANPPYEVGTPCEWW